jgi:hypothetical protein
MLANLREAAVCQSSFAHGKKNLESARLQIEPELGTDNPTHIKRSYNHPRSLGATAPSSNRERVFPNARKLYPR